MKVRITMSTPEIAISDNAKICYGTKGDKDITSQLVHKNKHLAVLRFAYATITVEGISVACQNQVVRSSHLDFLVQSKRYVNADKGEFKFIMPEGLTDSQQATMAIHWATSIKAYDELIADGCKKEDARAVLPANTSTKMNITGNLQGFDSFLKLRLSLHAQREIRNLAILILESLIKVFPTVFSAMRYGGKSLKEWKEHEE